MNSEKWKIKFFEFFEIQRKPINFWKFPKIHNSQFPMKSFWFEIRKSPSIAPGTCRPFHPLLNESSEGSEGHLTPKNHYSFYGSDRLPSFSSCLRLFSLAVSLKVIALQMQTKNAHFAPFPAALHFLQLRRCSVVYHHVTSLVFNIFRLFFEQEKFIKNLKNSSDFCEASGIFRNFLEKSEKFRILKKLIFFFYYFPIFLRFRNIFKISQFIKNY